MIYKITFVVFIIIGSVTHAGNILEISGLLILAMAFPSFIALYMFSGKVKGMLDEYIGKLKSGELDAEVKAAG